MNPDKVIKTNTIHRHAKALLGFHGNKTRICTGLAIIWHRK